MMRHLLFAMSESGHAADADVAVSIGRKDLSFRESRCAEAATPARIGRRANFESRCMPARGQRPELQGGKRASLRAIAFVCETAPVRASALATKRDLAASRC